MSEQYSISDEKCLLLAFYFGRIKLLNCVALQRITKDLMKAFETSPDNRSTKYSEPLDGCCLCEEKELLFKELLRKHAEGSGPESSDNEPKRDLEKAWADVSELWKDIVAKSGSLDVTEWRRHSAQACQNLIEKHGLKVFDNQEYSHMNFLAFWDSLIRGMKKKIKACCQSISTINGSASMPSNPGPNVTKWTMRNAYLFLVKKKAARQHAKFMQNCREVGVVIRAAREPVSVVVRLTLCTLCTAMGNKHKVVEVPMLLRSSITFLSSAIAIDDDPDIEPMFGEDGELKKTLRLKLPAKSTREVWMPVDHKGTIPPFNGSVIATLRRSDRTPAIKKKNESFLYYTSTNIKNIDTAPSDSMKKRRVSLTALAPTSSQSPSFLASTSIASPPATSLTQSVEQKTPISSTSIINKLNPSSCKDNLNVVIVTPNGQLETDISSKVNCIGHPAIPSSNMVSGPNMTPLKIVPSKSMPTVRSPQTLNISPNAAMPPTVSIPQSEIQQETIRAAQEVKSTFEINAKLQLLKAAMQSVAKKGKPQTYHAYCKPVAGDFKKKSQVIPITPTSLAQLINSKKSQRVFFFPANTAKAKGIEFEKPAVFPVAFSSSPSSRQRSTSLDSNQQRQKLLLRKMRPNMPLMTSAIATTAPAKSPVPKKSPLFVQIVNGRIQRPGGLKAEPSSIVKSISLAGNHVKFVKSVSLKSQSSIAKNVSNAGRLIQKLGKPDTVGTATTATTSSSTETVRKTLVLGGNMKQGSIMHIAPSATKSCRSSTHPLFQLGKSFTFKASNLSNEDKKLPIRGVAPKKCVFTNVPLLSPQGGQPAVTQNPTATKKFNPVNLHSPLRTPGKKKQFRPQSKSMATVVAEHIFSLMPPSADEELWKKLNAKNKRRSEKSSALIPVPYETNFLCIHDTIERYGWKAYWYWKCRCSKIREKAAESDLEYSEPNPADIAAWIPSKVMDAMRKTLTSYVESEDRISSVGISTSPQKDKSAPVARVLLEDCYPKSSGDQQEKYKVDESENVDVETVDDDVDAAESGRKRKISANNSEHPKRSSFGIIAKYKKDKNGNWIALSNLDQGNDSKPESEVETLSQSSVDSSAVNDDGDKEDSVMLNIQPELNSNSALTSSVSVEDQIGTTNDHGLRRCARVTMIRRKALVRRALDAEMRFKMKRERAENNASEIFLCSSFRYGSLADPNFSIVSAHPICFREEQGLCAKVAAAQVKRHVSRKELLEAKEERDKVQPAQPSNTEDSIISLLSSPLCTMAQGNTQLKNSNSTPLKSKPSFEENGKSLRDKSKLHNTVIVQSKKVVSYTVPSSSGSKTATWNSSDRRRKVVSQITSENAFSKLQVFRGVPATHPPTNVITRLHAEFVTKALQAPSNKLYDLNPVVVLPAPSFTLPLKSVVKTAISVPSETPESPPAESLPSWMKGNCAGKGKSPKNQKAIVPPVLPSECASYSSSKNFNIGASQEKATDHPLGATSPSARDPIMPPKEQHAFPNQPILNVGECIKSYLNGKLNGDINIGSYDDHDEAEVSDGTDCFEISIQKVYSLSSKNRSEAVTVNAGDCELSPPLKQSFHRVESMESDVHSSEHSLRPSVTANETETSATDLDYSDKHSLASPDANTLQSGKTGSFPGDLRSDDSIDVARLESSGLTHQTLISLPVIQGKKHGGGLFENVESPAIVHAERYDNSDELNNDKVGSDKETLKNMESKKSIPRNELHPQPKYPKRNHTGQHSLSVDKKMASFVPCLFTIHRDLRTMLKMSKRGSLAHLSLSRTKEQSIPFKKHLRRKFKANRNLATLLGHSYDLKRIVSRFKNDVKDTKKSIPGKGAKSGTKSNKVKRRKSLASPRPLSNMFNWIWDVNDVDNAKLAKFMPPATNSQPSAVKLDPISRESTPETARGPLLSKMANSAGKLKDFLPGGDMKDCLSPQTEEASSPGEVSEVQCPEPSPLSSAKTSPRYHRKRRSEGSHSLDGMYWTDLIVQDADQQLGKNLRRRRILSEESPTIDKEQVNKRKRFGVGFCMSGFKHASDILEVDKESVKRFNKEKLTIDWEDEDADIRGPLQSLFSQALNVDRLRLWIWDSTSPKPVQLQSQEHLTIRKKQKLYKHHSFPNKHTSSHPTSSHSQIIGESRSTGSDHSPAIAVKCGVLPKSYVECIPEIKRATIPLIRCSVPPEDSDSDGSPSEKQLCLIRRKARGKKTGFASRPKGLSRHHFPSKKRRKLDFFALFDKIKRDKLHKSLANCSRPRDVVATVSLEQEVVVDVDEGIKTSVPVKLEPQFDESWDSANASFYGPPRKDDIVLEHYFPWREKRNHSPSKKSNRSSSENDSSARQLKKRKSRREGSTDGIEEADEQELKQTVLDDWKQHGRQPLPGRTKGGTDRRRNLLQSRCSTKGGFISRLVECGMESVDDNDL